MNFFVIQWYPGECLTTFSGKVFGGWEWKQLLFVAPANFPGVNISTITYFKLPAWSLSMGSWRRQKSALRSQYEAALQHRSTVSCLGPCPMYWNLLPNFCLFFLTSAPASLLVFCAFFFFSFVSSPLHFFSLSFSLSFFLLFPGIGTIYRGFSSISGVICQVVYFVRFYFSTLSLLKQWIGILLVFVCF